MYTYKVETRSGKVAYEVYYVEMTVLVAYSLSKNTDFKVTQI